MKFRLADISDAEQILAIYQPYVDKTTVSSEVTSPILEDFRARIAIISNTFPYIVAVDGPEENIVGFTYAKRYREREAYDWAVELSIYINEDYHGHQLGKELYTRLFALLQKLNYHWAYACITTPNPKSVRFHEKLGFQKVGEMKQVAYKLGIWYGIEWMELKLQDNLEAKRLLTITDLDQEEVKRILE